MKAVIRGAVQGVGFRPFVFRLAGELGLSGWVNNSAQGVFLEAEGCPAALHQFLLRLEAERPPRSFITSLEATWLDAVGYDGFEIRPSETGGAKTALVLPDIATCPDCRREIFDPNNRRYRYPFTNCTNCGPRFSIIESLPYDRGNTTMRAFTMCPECQAEYDDPRDRRFHAQPNACPRCGPHLELWDESGAMLSGPGGHRLNSPDLAGAEIGSREGDCDRTALAAAVNALRQGQIVAVKGLGGFHLLAAAQNDQAVQRLRTRKHREEKPFALMFPTLTTVETFCEVSTLEERLLRSPEAPIVLLRRRSVGVPECWSVGEGTPHHSITPSLHYSISSGVAPGNPYLGVMLPYSPLHHLLLAELRAPVVATSGNRSDEPIATDERDAVERLRGIADLFLVHNRPIVRHVDDSVVRVMLGRELVLRRARGYAPLPIRLKCPKSKVQNPKSENKPPRRTVLAVGAHLKNTVALSVDSQVFVSQHIGDLENAPAYEAFQKVTRDFERLYEARPDRIAADLHPDYLSTKFAQASGLPVVGVQHHLAHVLACLAENEIEPPLLGVSWDGTGCGSDGTIWGGEFFRVTNTAGERVAHWRPFRLPGGDRAVKEPRRAALGLLYELFGPDAFRRNDLACVAAFAPAELAALKTMLDRKVQAPLTSSVGRLFDAVASLAGLRQRVRFEGQAAMELEFALDSPATNEAYGLRITDYGLQTESAAATETPSPIANRPSPIILDWSPMIEEIITDLERGVGAGEISVKFHNALAESIVAVAMRIGEPRVALSGGCFQNRYLTERTVHRLEEEGFHPYWHQRIPPNDGGIALGQIVGALRSAETFQ